MATSILNNVPNTKAQFVQGEIVICREGQNFWVVLVSGENTDDDEYFAGTILASYNNSRIGERCSHWVKAEFSLFTGSVTISN